MTLSQILVHMNQKIDYVYGRVPKSGSLKIKKKRFLLILVPQNIFQAEISMQ